MQLIRLTLIALLNFSSLFALAGGHVTNPMMLGGKDFFKKLKYVAQEQAFQSDNATTITKICSCQILDMKSSNYDHRHVAVLAEKTFNGKSQDYQIAHTALEKEKKQLRKMFYDKLEVVSAVEENTDCKTLYVKLKYADQNLILYEVLNADILIRQ
jgi:hypothetical protein